MPLNACMTLLQTKKLLTFEEIEVGLVLHADHEFTRAELDSFAALSGDRNPLHVDREAAVASGFRDRTVYGFLLASLLSGISGSSFHNSVCAAVSMDFVQPAFPGERIEVLAEVVQVQPAIRGIGMKARLTRGQDLIARGKLTTKFLKDNPAPRL